MELKNKTITWPTKKLGEVCELIPPGIKKFDGVKKYIATADVDFDKTINFTEITYDHRPTRANMEAVENDILVAKMAKTRKFLVANKEFQKDYIFSTGFAILKAKNQYLFPKYLFYFLTTKDFNAQKDKLAVGVTQKAINSEALKKIKIPIPPLPIQQKIVERLDAIRKAQELNNKQIALADELFQSLLHREVGHKEKDWRVERLREVAEITMGQSPPSSTYNSEGNGLPFFQGKFEFGEFYPTPIKFCSQAVRIAKKNDVLLSVRAPVGPVNLAPSECCIGRGLSGIRTKEKKLDQLFLFYFMKLSEKKMSFLGTGSTFTAIGKDHIKNLKISFPTLSIQRHIVQKLQAVQAYKKKLLKQKQKLQELFESCLAKAMKGELVN